LSVKLGDKPLLVIRAGTKAAAVRIQTDDRADTAGTHLFFELEGRMEALPVLDGACIEVRCPLDAGAQRSRLLRLANEAPQLCLTWTSADQITLEAGRYVIKTTRVVAAGPKLLETTECLLDNQRVDGGLARATTILDDTPAALVCSNITREPISVTQHCAIARRLERDGLNEAALHHARAALTQADADKLEAEDGRRLEARALMAKLEARLRPAVELTK
jgi:hypothetical protein